MSTIVYVMFSLKEIKKPDEAKEVKPRPVILIRKRREEKVLIFKKRKNYAIVISDSCFIDF